MNAADPCHSPPAAPPASHSAGQPDASLARRELCREDLARGSLRDAYLKSDLADLAWSDARLQHSLDHTLGTAPGRRKQAGNKTVTGSADIWIFAYGSLIWNPIFPIAEKRVARIYGLHRSFCLWSRLGRGTRENPGLVLGLDDGGACSGLALRMDAAHQAEELLLLWRREMVTGAYTPTWVKARTAQGAVDAIAFVMNQHSHAYAGRLPEAQIVENIRQAAGINGRCSEYLAQTSAGLATHGIADAGLKRLAALCGCGA